jgi:Rod binding domain-containing protein
MALQETQAQDILQRKLEMDALKKRLSGQQDEKTRLREACQGFEAVFINKLWEQMRKNVSKEGYLHSRDEETYQSMFDYEFSKKMAEAGGIGLADMLYEQLAQRLGESSRTSSTNIDPAARIIQSASSPRNMQLAGGGNIKPLKDELTNTAERPGLELNKLKPEIKPFVRDRFGPEGKVPFVPEMDFEAISQNMLKKESLFGETAPPEAPVFSARAQLSPMESALLHAALNRSAEEVAYQVKVGDGIAAGTEFAKVPARPE